MKINAGLSLLALCAALCTAQENYLQWPSQKPVTVNTQTTGAAVTGNVVKFPLLIRLTSANADVFTGSKGKGADIRFAKINGVHLKYQIERWDSAGQMAEIWVLADTVYGNGSTGFNMYWGKGGVSDSSNGPGVFDIANGFVGVWHLGDAPKNQPRPSAVAGAPTALLRNYDSATYAPTAGIIGLSDSLAGGPGDNLMGNTANYIDLNHRGYQGFSDFSTGFSFSTWIYESAQVAFERFIELLDDSTTSASSDTRIILFGNKNPPINGPSVRWGANGIFNGATDNTYAQNAWYHLFFSKPGGPAPMTLYSNGKQIEVTETLPDLVAGLRNYAYMGRSSVTASDAYYQGKFDEPEISKVARDSNWVKLCYQTQKAGATTVLLGTTLNALPPGAPTTVTGIAGNGQVTLSWMAPSVDGGAAINGYNATSNPGNFTCVTAGVSSCIVIGLTNGIAYTFTVRATNSAGTGPASSASSPITPVAPPGTPGSPTAVSGVVGNALVAISWTAPASNGGTAITAYTVTAAPGGATCATTGVLNCTVMGLTNGTAYTFTVVAANPSGPSAASIPSPALTPRTVPGVPTGVTAVGGGGQISIAWMAPIFNGGSAITVYTATSVEDTSKHCATTGALTCAVTGLTGTYSFTVKATNIAGTGAASSPSTPVTGIQTFKQSGFGLRILGSSVMVRIPETFANARISILDLRGRPVWSQLVKTGTQELSWNGKTSGRSTAQGIYFLRVTAEIDGKLRVLAESKLVL